MDDKVVSHYIVKGNAAGIILNSSNKDACTPYTDGELSKDESQVCTTAASGSHFEDFQLLDVILWIKLTKRQQNQPFICNITISLVL